MMARSAYEEFISDPNRRRLLEQERLILDATEHIYRLLEEQGLTKADLAQKLGKTPSHVTKVLYGDRNMTLRTLADFLFALGYTARITVEPIGAVAKPFVSTNSFFVTHSRPEIKYRAVRGESQVSYDYTCSQPIGKPELVVYQKVA